MTEFSNHYIDWRRSRIAGLEKYFDTSILKYKTVLELGCGYADIGSYFNNNYECNITVSDARDEHLSVVAQKFPELKQMKFDCDNDVLLIKYDVILHWGVMYHISNIEEHIKNTCESCDYLLLETEVVDSIDENDIIYINEVGYDQAFNNKGCRPSPKYIEKQLVQNGFSFKLITDSILNSSTHNYSWLHTNDKSYRNGLRRFWIAWRNGIESPLR